MANSSLSHGCYSSPCARIAHFHPLLSPLTAEFYLRATPASLVLQQQSSGPAAFLGPPGAPGLPDFALLQNQLLCLKSQQVPSAVTAVAQMSPHCDQGPPQGFSGGTRPCHLVGLCSCTPRPQVSKEFISNNQVCLVIPHWEGCESTENNFLHPLSGAATCPRPEAVPGAPCPSQHKERLICTWGRAHLCSDCRPGMITGHDSSQKVLIAAWGRREELLNNT